MNPCNLSNATSDHILEGKQHLYKVMRPRPFMIRVITLLQASCSFCSAPVSSRLEGSEEQPHLPEGKI